MLLLRAAHNTSLLVVSDALLKEVCLACQRNVLHEVKGVRDFVELFVAESKEKSVSDELNVLLHQVCVHAKKCARECLGQEFLFNGNSFSDDGLDGLFTGSVFQVREQEAGEVGVKTLVARDELIRECETGHETALLEPKD